MCVGGSVSGRRTEMADGCASLVERLRMERGKEVKCDGGAEAG